MRWLAVLALIGCYSPASTRCEPCSGVEACPGGLACIAGRCQAAANDCDRDRDGGTDTQGGEASACFGVQARPMFEVCPATVPSGTRVLTASIDTSADTDCTYVQAADVTLARPEACVIAADRIVIDAPTRAIGSRPLVVVARESLQINANGALLLHGTNADPDSTDRPAAGNVPACASPRGTDNPANTGAGGGPGGTFRGRGGIGAAGNGATATLAPEIITSALSLRGGCRGGDGGQAGAPLVAGGLGGNSGGAVYLLAPMIQIDGVVNASGGGARAALNQLTGGGGGGSGGMILVWSASPLVLGTNAQIFALGGGGGTGVGGADTGLAGADPASPTMPAGPTGAPQGSGAGDGGGGGASGTIDGKNGSAGATGGGGGGGGGAGYIKIVPAMTSMQIAPPSS